MKKRSGNLIIVIVVFAFMAMTLAAIFSISVSQREKARRNAEKAGDINSYITIANLCADAFKNDLESEVVSFEASLTNLSAEYGAEIYHDATKMIQEELTKDEGETAGSWIYYLKDPKDVFDYIGVTSAEMSTVAERLLEHASVKITIKEPLTGDEIEETDDISLEDGNTVSLDAIYYTVVLEKGTTYIEQDYCLEGEHLICDVKYDSRNPGVVSRVQIKVNAENANNMLISQTVYTKNHKEQR